MTTDVAQRARACQVLLTLVGFEGETLWNDRGPSKRASWIKGYIRREAPRRPRPNAVAAGALSWIDALSRREKIVLLVAFDIWNGSGGVPFAQVLNLTPRLVSAVAGLMEALCSKQAEPLGTWIERWSSNLEK